MTDKDEFTISPNSVTVGGAYISADKSSTPGQLEAVTTVDGVTYHQCEDGRFRTKPKEIDPAQFSDLTGMAYPMPATLAPYNTFAEQVYGSISNSPEEWHNDMYHFSNSVLGISFWVANGFFHFSPEASTNTRRFTYDERWILWRAYKKWNKRLALIAANDDT